MLSNQVHHHKINYYSTSDIDFARSLAELARAVDQLSAIEQKISQMNALLTNDRAENRQRINYFLIDEQRNHYIDKIEVR